MRRMSMTGTGPSIRRGPSPIIFVDSVSSLVAIAQAGILEILVGA